MSAYDVTRSEIICGKHHDMCCVTPILLTKYMTWQRLFGDDETMDMIMMACKCLVDAHVAAEGIAPADVSSGLISAITSSNEDLPTADATRQISISSASGGAGIARRLQDHINDLENDFQQNPTPQRWAEINPSLDVGFYPFGYGFMPDIQLAPSLVNGRVSGLSFAAGLTQVLNAGGIYSGTTVGSLLDLDIRKVNMVGNVPPDRRKLPSFNIHRDPNAANGLLGMAQPYPIIGLAATADGHTLINQDPSLTFYLQMLGVTDADDLASKEWARLYAFLWVVENRRINLLPAFTLGPWNQWLGRSKLTGYKGSHSLFNTWADIEAALLAHPLYWITALEQDVMAVDPKSTILNLPQYVTGKLGTSPTARFHPSEIEKLTSMLRGLSDLNRMNLHQDAISATAGWSTKQDDSGTFAFHLLATQDAFLRRAVEMKWIQPPTKDWEAINWKKSVHDKQMAALMGAISFTATAVVAVASLGAGSAMAGAVGGAVSSALGAAWKTVGGYVTAAWTSITQSGVLGFVQKYAVPMINTSLQIAGERPPPFLREIGGWQNITSKDVNDAYARWSKTAIRTIDETGNRKYDVLKGPLKIKF
jgi:hypothetical protein